MSYVITGRGGLYPDGCAFQTLTANGAIERRHAVYVTCGQAAVQDDVGRALSFPQLAELAKAELSSEV